MSKPISGAEYPLSKIFSSEFEYTIPSYQRPYAWTTDETSELFDDLWTFYTTEPEDSYFLGSIVLIKEDTKPGAEVIDGQQRLTTLTILLAVMASHLSGEHRSVLTRYIKEPGNEFEGLQPKPRLTLRERDQPFFAKYVQTLNFDELYKLDRAGLDNESQQNLQANGRLLHKMIEGNLADDAVALRKFAAFLVQRCYIVAVSTPNQQSAFRVFSVMNSRGLDLQPTDIIKADTIGKIGSEADQRDYNERWEDMEVELGRTGFNDLFAYVRMIFAKEKAKRALIEEFRNQVLCRVETSKALIEDILEPHAEALATIRQSNYVASTNAEDINSYLRWLNRIDNSDWVPPAIAFLATQKDNPEYVKWFFGRLERLGAYMHICARNVNERIERYAELLSALEEGHGPEQPVEAVELTDSEKSAMRIALNGSVYELTARRRNYLLLRLDSFLSDGGATYDPSVLTIEHVLPQTVDDTSEWAKSWPDKEIRRQWVHRIANLVPLNRRRNSRAQNYDFELKKSAYFAGRTDVSSYVLTTQVLQTQEWTPDVVQSRQEDLLGVLAEHWSLGEPSAGARRDETFFTSWLNS